MNRKEYPFNVAKTISAIKRNVYEKKSSVSNCSLRKMCSLESNNLSSRRNKLFHFIGIVAKVRCIIRLTCIINQQSIFIPFQRETEHKH